MASESVLRHRRREGEGVLPRGAVRAGRAHVPAAAAAQARLLRQGHTNGCRKLTERKCSTS